MNRLPLLIIICICFLQNESTAQNQIDYSKALVSFDDYEMLIDQVKVIREKRLISFNELLKLQKNRKTVILDARSKDKFEKKHLEGAINLPFTEFTTNNLRALIPDPDTRIIIYCNNNFEGDQKYFASKTFNPELAAKRSMMGNRNELYPKSIMLALNIPTYLALHGYGYTNIYELNELVDIDDARVKLEGDNGMLSYRNLPTKRLQPNKK